MTRASPVVPIVGVFDSGVGGLSVLRALRARLPGANIEYIADSAYAPYGERPVAEVVERSTRLAERLAADGAAIIVVACNTATALAIDALRQRWPTLPFVGVEPAIKPAAASTRNGRIGVLATPATLASDRLRALVQRHAQGATVHLQPCPGLAAAIETGALDGHEIDTLLARFCEPLRQADVDTVVLGCTHYPFVASRIEALMGPQVRIIDTADAVAARVATLWTGTSAPRAALRLRSTGDAAQLAALASRWLGLSCEAQHVVV